MANCKFALSLDADNWRLQARLVEAEKLRAEGRMTCPVTMGDEFKTNPYLRLTDPAIRDALGMADASELDVFTEIRTRKNNFK